jgi:hypothetical protein
MISASKREQEGAFDRHQEMADRHRDHAADDRATRRPSQRSAMIPPRIGVR